MHKSISKKVHKIDINIYKLYKNLKDLKDTLTKEEKRSTIIKNLDKMFI